MSSLTMLHVGSSCGGALGSAVLLKWIVLSKRLVIIWRGLGMEVSLWQSSRRTKSAFSTIWFLLLGWISTSTYFWTVNSILNHADCLLTQSAAKKASCLLSIDISHGLPFFRGWPSIQFLPLIQARQVSNLNEKFYSKIKTCNLSGAGTSVLAKLKVETATWRHIQNDKLKICYF